MLDRDASNLAKATEILQDTRITPIHSSFAHLPTLLESAGIPSIDGILYDLGVSSVHYDEAERGFSLRENGPLDMRFDQSSDIPTAEDVINRIPERELFRACVDFADEPKALFIARAICEYREKKRICTTKELSDIISTASFDPKSPLRVFQAIRILVNQEFEHIRQSIPAAISALKPDGRLCVITFHSIEDRLIKNICREYETPKVDEYTGRILEYPILKKVYKKPVEPSQKEIAENPRSRSAKLRVYQKLAPQKHERTFS